MNGAGSRNSDTVYDDSDISARRTRGAGYVAEERLLDGRSR
jgi:hypothetical protein